MVSCSQSEQFARKKKKEAASSPLRLTEREVTPNTVENSDDPSGSSKSQCLSAAWFLLTLSGSYIYTVHSSQVASLFFTEKKVDLTNEITTRGQNKLTNLPCPVQSRQGHHV